MPPLIAIVGPTGIGKTALAIKIAQAFSGQIVSADSRQVYQLMDIGTAKPSTDELVAAPHRLIDIVSPDYVLTLAEFQERAYAAIDAIHAQGDLPLLAGGTGQWVWSVVEGWGIPRVPPDLTLRAELEAAAKTVGSEAFHAKLAAVDPDAAAKLDHRNVRRVIRALEVYLKTGIPISAHQKKSPPPYRILMIGLNMPRESLYLRIDDRIDRMMEAGFLAEVEDLLARGYNLHYPSMSGLGYRQLGRYLHGEISLEEAVALTKKETRRFIRQQYNWFRLDDERIFWLDVLASDFADLALAKLSAFLEEGENVTAQLDKVYEKEPSTLDAELLALQVVSIGDEKS
ncbi:MAG TPA: tRNA (adenosine(37)-N6)-dimethylallyltransferase MiaA [Chloroflexi bacterium]|nr:tRNA (adenosine(37)-N6)-dimethylallyltransferase MiaA [Chloroflexota bacterium]